MNRAEVLQEVRLMKFEELYSRRQARELTQEQAAEILSVSVRTVQRWEERFEANGAEGLYDGRLGKLANNRVPTDTVMSMLELFDTQYWALHAEAFPRKAGGKARVHPKLQLGAADTSGPGPDAASPKARSAPAQATPAPDGRHDVSDVSANGTV